MSATFLLTNPSFRLLLTQPRHRVRDELIQVITEETGVAVPSIQAALRKAGKDLLLASTTGTHEHYVIGQLVIEDPAAGPILHLENPHPLDWDFASDELDHLLEQAPSKPLRIFAITEMREDEPDTAEIACQHCHRPIARKHRWAQWWHIADQDLGYYRACNDAWEPPYTSYELPFPGKNAEPGPSDDISQSGENADAELQRVADEHANITGRLERDS